ncbi:MAG: glyoxylase family protein [Thermoproteota archaeon]|nr:glyoxylase family protein [Thermoproteota archaeon]
MRFEHVAIMVSDLERSIDFYMKVFGFQILRKTSRPHAFLYLGDDCLEVIPDKEVSQKTPRPLYHIAFYTDKPLEEEVKRLNEMGVSTTPIRITTFEDAQIVQMSVPPPNSEKLQGAMKPGTKDPKKAWRMVRFNDPDSILLEIWERR